MKALLVHPTFSPFSFWNYKNVCRLAGAKYPASPLGLTTMAALLPQEWELQLVDMNTRPLDDSDIDWADLVFVGGMLPQQAPLLNLIDRVHSRGRKVVVGGPDPTSQPEAYGSADYLVLGEAERSLPLFLTSFNEGAEGGTFVSTERPEMSETPIPRFDLLDLGAYLMIGVQFSRGCPFNCEFCDIIELFGRKTRTKSPEQVVAELQALYDLGYRGHIDLVDDNLIGHRRKAAAMLRAVLRWSRAHHFPFYFSTEASLNLADDEELLGLMEALDFRYVFIGIESPDNAVLKSTGKRANVNRDIVADLHRIYRHGIVVNGGFIVGFDNETSASAPLMIKLIEDGKICMAMVGLLYALPNTQLRHRLEREGRLLDESDSGQGNSDIDQATSGINFIATRPRSEVMGDLLTIIDQVYSTRAYFNRCLRVSMAVSVKSKYRPPLREMLKSARSFLRTISMLGLRFSTGYYYWRNLLLVLFRKPSSVETLVNLMAMYLHFNRQSHFLTQLMGERRRIVGEAERDSTLVAQSANVPV